jgi:plastocyanin
MFFNIKRGKMRKEVVISALVLILVAAAFLFVVKNMLGGDITGMAIGSGDGIVSDTQDTRSSLTGKNYVVDIEVFKFIPDKLRIRVGDSVTWVNHDKAKHKIYTGINGDGSVLIDSGFLVKGASYTMTFDEAGVYEYWSAAWPYVQGTIIVEQPRS